MRYRDIGSVPASRRTVSVLSLGTMLFGTRIDEPTSFAILDYYAEAGGTFLDTSNNYAYWVEGTCGGESEALLGRWLKGVGGSRADLVVATKLGARPLAPGTGFVDNAEGLSAAAIRAAAEQSRERLGTDRIDLLYAHIEDPATPLAETVETFAELVAEGTVGLLGASNHWSWRVERARALAAAANLPGYEVLQYHHTYLRRRTDLPGTLSPDGEQGLATGEILSYVRAEPGLALVAYSPLLQGAYARPDRPLDADHDHAGTPLRRAALRRVAAEAGATPNQVVLAWLLGGEVPVIPLVGASSVAQLKESLAAVELELTAEQRASLDRAGNGEGDE